MLIRITRKRFTSHIRTFINLDCLLRSLQSPPCTRCALFTPTVPRHSALQQPTVVAESTLNSCIADSDTNLAKLFSLPTKPTYGPTPLSSLLQTRSAFHAVLVQAALLLVVVALPFLPSRLARSYFVILSPISPPSDSLLRPIMISLSSLFAPFLAMLP